MKLFLFKFLIITSLCFFSCNEKTPCALADEELVLILADVQIAESAAQSIIGPARDSLLDAYYRQIFEIHEVGEEEFRDCFRALEEDPERMSEIYELVIEELNRQEARDKEKPPATPETGADQTTGSPPGQ